MTPRPYARNLGVAARLGGELGRWLDESRDVHADYHRMIGGPHAIVRVWLIANSLFLRGGGGANAPASRRGATVGW
jgi:hypothetical protein